MRDRLIRSFDCVKSQDVKKWLRIVPFIQVTKANIISFRIVVKFAVAVFVDWVDVIWG
jgi:hypothetical protein